MDQTLRAALQGIFLAFGLIMPLGVQNAFVFTQGALARGWRDGLPVVLTASLCDNLLILAAISGVSLLVVRTVWFKTALGWAGVAFLAYFGWVTWRRKPELSAAAASAATPSPGRLIAFTASVSLLNPHAILDTVGVIGTTALHYAGPARVAFTGACALVSWLWFLGLFLTGRLLGAASPSHSLLRWVNRVSAVIMWGVAVQLLVGNL